MADIAALRELCAWMREEGVLYARTGELELRLEPKSVAPPKSAPTHGEPSEAASESEENVDDVERRTLETLLYSSGAEVEPILRVLRGKSAA